MNYNITLLFEQLLDKIWALTQKPQFLFLLSIPVLLIYPWESRGVDPDFFARIAVGRLFQRDGGITKDDPFAFTPKHDSWIDHEWLAGVVFFYVVENWQEHGVFLLKLLFFFATILIVIFAQRDASSIRKPSLSWFIIAFWPTVYVWSTNVRSQVFTYLLLAIILWIVALSLRGVLPWWRWLLPIIFPLFVNAHGGFVVPLGFLGIGLLANNIIERHVEVRNLLLISLCILSSLVNPYGFEYWIYLFQALTMSRPDIIEWRALPIISLFGLYILFSLVVILYVELFTKKDKRIVVVLLLIISAFAALRSGRFIAVYYFVATIFGVDAWQYVCEKFFSKHNRFSQVFARSMLCVFLIISCSRFFYSIKQFPLNRSFTLNYDAYPVAALEMLYHCASPGNLLVDFNSGSFALWRLYPKVLVSLDGRYEEVYPQETFDLVKLALNYGQEGQLEALRSINPDYILLNKDWPASKNLDYFAPGYELAYEDDKFLILTENTILDCMIDSRPLLKSSF